MIVVTDQTITQNLMLPLCRSSLALSPIRDAKTPLVNRFVAVLSLGGYRSKFIVEFITVSLAAVANSVYVE
jgi:hypothetical protein